MLDYNTGVLLHAINEKLDYLIERLQEAEKKAKGGKKDGKSES